MIVGGLGETEIVWYGLVADYVSVLPSICIRSLSCHTTLEEERCVTSKEDWGRALRSKPGDSWGGEGRKGTFSFFPLSVLYFFPSLQLSRKETLLCEDHFSFTIFDVVSVFELLLLT